MVEYEQSERLKKLPPYLFVRLEEMVAEKRKEGVRIIDFGIGDPDLSTPDKIVKSLQVAAEENDNQKYSSSEGEKDLRDAVAKWYKKRFKVEINPDTQVCITSGSKEAIFNISQAFVNPGETIIAPSPGYPVYSGASTLFNEAVCVKVPLRPENDWLLDVNECPADAKMLYINYPNNPTGATCDLEYVKKVYDWCERTGTIMCYDNAYSEMCYDGYKAPSALQAGPNCIEFGSFSKTFNMTGFRLGYAVGHPDLIGGLKKCKGQIDSGAPIFIQKAGITALETYGEDGNLPSVIQNNMNIYSDRRKMLVEGLKDLGFDVVMPKGTFYIWFNCGMPSAEFVEKMIQLGIVVTPGSGFGESADGYVRMTVTESVEHIKEALNRMKKAFRESNIQDLLSIKVPKPPF
jgi:Aspartate/tyrosine/aromatic aminotransferase